MPLLALLAPRVASDVVRSLVEGASESGAPAKWELGGTETGIMVGDPAPLLVAGAWAFGARGFDAGAAFAAMSRTASEPQAGPFRYPSHAAPLDGARWGPFVGRPGLADYLQLGYVPLDHDDGFIRGPASTTLEYALADFALGRFARAIGRDATRVRDAVGELAAPLQPRHAPPRAAPRGRLVPARLLAHDGGRLRRGQLRAVHVVRAARRRRAGRAHGRRRDRPEPARPLSPRSRREPSRAVCLARERAELRHAVALQLARCSVADAGGRAARSDDALPAAPRRAAGRRRPRRALGVVRLERARALSGRSGRRRPGDREPLFPSVTIRSGLGRLRLEAPRAAAAVPYVHDLRLDGKPTSEPGYRQRLCAA